MNPQALDQAAADLGLRPPRKGSGLTCPAPEAGATAEVLLAWLTEQLRLPAPAARAERFGTDGDAVLVLNTTDGQRVRFAAQRDVMNPARIVEAVVFGLGSLAPHLPTLTKADAQDIGTALVRACVTIEADDARDDAQGWALGFLRVTQELHAGDYTDQAARYAGVRWLTEPPAFEPRSARLAAMDQTYRAPLLRWADGSAMVRVGDVYAYVTGVERARLSVAQLHGRMLEIGWQRAGRDGRAQAWRPGAPRTDANRAKVAAYVVPEGWGS